MAQNRYFDDPAFVNYLGYLQYWAELPYCLHLTFPHCLRMLELLQVERFRASLKHPDFKEHIFQQQYQHWRYRNEESARRGEERPSPPYPEPH